MNPIYLVEDDPLIRRYLEDLLEHVLGCPVRSWLPGEDVVATAAENRPPLILLDITLRGATLDGAPTDGLQLCRRIKARMGAEAPPVMLLTAHAVEGDRERFLADSGADDYQAKPIFDENDFLARLRGLIGQ
ncbi:MAG: response regulator [Planctomycetota bacterium]|nr:MAG: response regulator [Planctomycetota bacterium]